MKHLLVMLTVLLSLNAFAQDYTLDKFIIESKKMKGSHIYKNLKKNGLKKAKQVTITHATLSDQAVKTLDQEYAGLISYERQLLRDLKFQKDPKFNQIWRETLQREWAIQLEIEKGKILTTTKIVKRDMGEFKTELAKLLNSETKIESISIQKKLASNSSKVLKKALPYLGVITLFLTAEDALAGTKERAKLENSKAIFDVSRSKITEKGSSKKIVASAKSSKTSAQ